MIKIDWYVTSSELGLMDLGSEWPKYMNSFHIAMMQYGDDRAYFWALVEALSYEKDKGIFRKATNLDIGRIMPTRSRPEGVEITSDFVLASRLYSSFEKMKGDDIKEMVYSASFIKSFLITNDEEPSEYIKQWFNAALKSSKIKKLKLVS